MKYVCVTIKSSRKCAYLYESTKMSFYRSFNAVFNHSKRASSEMLSVYLLNSVCIPILMYALEVTAPNLTIFHSLDGAVDNAIRKFFSVSDQSNIKYIKSSMMGT